MAEGINVVRAALDAKAPVESLFVAAESRKDVAVAELVDRALDAGARVFELGSGVMERVADTVTPQPVCAVIASVDVSVETLLEGSSGRDGRLLLVCVDVRDPGNLGAVMRSAAAAGAAGILCCEGTADPYNAKTVRASAGAIFRLPLALAGPPADAVEHLAAAACRIVATSAHGGTDYALADFSGDVALLLGNEASGLSDELTAMAGAIVTIPMAEGSESLNVAMTAAVLCHEAARQRRSRHPASSLGPESSP